MAHGHVFVYHRREYDYYAQRCMELIVSVSHSQKGQTSAFFNISPHNLTDHVLLKPVKNRIFLMFCFAFRYSFGYYGESLCAHHRRFAL